MFLSSKGSPSAADVLSIACPIGTLASLPLDPRIMFVMSRFDGWTPLGTVLEMADMELEAIGPAIADLLRRGVLRRLR